MSDSKQCIFCIEDPKIGNHKIPPEQIIGSYQFWWLLLQPLEKRNKTKQAAGMLIPKRHIPNVSSASSDEAKELIAVIKDSAKSLCEAVGTVYTNQETVGFNQGLEAGQTVEHAHVHILPVSESDPSELKVRGGMGGAFEALREARLRKT